MRSFRKNTSFNRPSYVTKKSSWLAVIPILPNAIAIAFFIGVFYYVFVLNHLYPDYVGYAYWTMKIIVGYNILAASARSLWAPLLAILAGGAGVYVNSAVMIPKFLSFMMNMSLADSWQLIGAGVVGLVILLMLKL